MTVWGIAQVRDEADIIEAVVRWMATQVDHLLVADNNSADGTREILEGLASDLPLTLRDQPRVGYYQSRHMTALAGLAAKQGAEWVVPFDADEIHVTETRERIADVLGRLPDEVLVSEASLFDHVATAADPDETNPVKRIGWRRSERAALRKIACRTSPILMIHQGNHSAAYEGVEIVPMVSGHIEVRHFPYRSPEQMVRKALNGREAYEATTLSADAGKHWRDYARLVDDGGPEALHEVFREWFWSADPETDPGLFFDPCPLPASL